ncbi:MAG: gamma-glutamyltransferase [Myxococcota bacterium]|nr:gamma-glutamyltransferase [Myxococcota bacterium]
MPAGSSGVVASGHAEVSTAAAEMLRAGGNAFDAALAAGFAASVAEPMFTSLGGGGFLLARSADGAARVFDFFVDGPGLGLPERALEPHFVPVTVHFPASDQVFHAGLGSVAVPGNLAGFLHVHEALGSLPLRELVAPAVRLARDGVVLNQHQAYVQGLLEPILDLTPTGRAIYSPEGRGLREGETLTNPELAAFLETLPEHRGRDLYEGELGARVAADMVAGQGILTADDLAAYRVREQRPLACRYRGHTLLTNPAPSLGGPLIARTIALLETRELGTQWGEAKHLCALAEVMEEVEKLRTGPAAGGTTHVSVCDAEGSCASLSLSNGEGSGYFVPGTGIMLNNMLGEDDLHPDGFHASPPGERVGSMMSPTLALDGGRPELVLGSGGSKRIRSAIVQVLTAVLDFGLGVREAVEAPRLHWDGACLQVEPGFPAAAVEALVRDRPINPWEERNLYFGGVHAVAPGGEGAGDPRRQGHGSKVESRAVRR